MKVVQVLYPIPGDTYYKEVQFDNPKTVWCIAQIDLKRHFVKFVVENNILTVSSEYYPPGISLYSAEYLGIQGMCAKVPETSLYRFNRGTYEIS